MTSNCSATCSASGWAKIVRTAAATISWLPFGTTARTLRMKCTRHRCQAAPMNTEAIAAFRPVWASVMTSCTPARPRAFRRAQERGPERPVLGVADVEPEHLPAAVGGHPGGDHHRLRDHPPVHPRLAVGRIEEDIRVGDLGQRPVPERADLLIQVRADPGHLGLADPGVGTECLDQVVDLPGRDPVQVGLHDHREQRLIDPPPPLQQGGEERPGPQLRDPQLQITGGRGQRPRTAPVALRGPFRAAFPWARTDHMVSSASINAW